MRAIQIGEGEWGVFNEWDDAVYDPLVSVIHDCFEATPTTFDSCDDDKKRCNLLYLYGYLCTRVVNGPRDRLSSLITCK